MIVNPRGTSGSGKTELARRILAAYGWERGGTRNGGIEPIYREGRSRPLAYRLQHPFGGRPLIVLGHYEAASGGCDTIRAVDGGIAEIMRLAGESGSDGHDVLIEGLRLSSEVDNSVTLAQSHEFHVLRLSTSLEQCVRNLVSRRRLGRDAVPALARSAGIEHRKVEEACRCLAPYVRVEVLGFEDALIRARDLLGLEERTQATRPFASP